MKLCLKLNDIKSGSGWWPNVTSNIMHHIHTDVTVQALATDIT
jgi:hypothetical protein